MAVLLFKLNGVPEDEAEEVRALLDEHKISYYETSAGNWGVSMGALWLKDEQQYEAAKQILHDYSDQRQLAMQETYQEKILHGRFRFYVSEVFKHPLRLLFYLAVMLLVAYVSVVPFINFGR